MKLSVVIPVYNGRDYLAHCLLALRESTRRADEIIVVDDGSEDDLTDVVRGPGVLYLAVRPGPHGPAFARNRGCKSATGDVLVFLDSDTAIHPDALQLIESNLQAQADVSAIFGSYDARPSSPGLVSRYKNLLHHYVHQHARRQAFTFWAGCGAIRRDAFNAVGCFDETFSRPSIEDIELGARLRRAGHRVLLCPEIQVTHLKHWTLRSLLRADIVDRAIPWSRLLVGQGAVPADLNLDGRSRVSAVLAWVWALCLVAGVVWYPVWVGAFVALAAVLLLNRDLYRFFARSGGALFALGATALHLFYLLYSCAVFAVVSLESWVRRLIPQAARGHKGIRDTGTDST
ncbi:MAG: glycosyltransferase [Chloroflexi bacterium]|nr:glycosyltransferase [Chloroflexota bacterium]